MAEFRIFCFIDGVRDGIGVAIKACMAFSANPKYLPLMPNETVTGLLPSDILEVFIDTGDRYIRFIPCDGRVFAEQWDEIKRLREENEELRAQIKVAA